MLLVPSMESVAGLCLTEPAQCGGLLAALEAETLPNLQVLRVVEHSQAGADRLTAGLTAGQTDIYSIQEDMHKGELPVITLLSFQFCRTASSHPASRLHPLLSRDASLHRQRWRRLLRHNRARVPHEVSSTL